MTEERPKSVPKTRQAIVLQDVLENRGNKSMRQAMLDAGYSEAYAKNPKQFRETASWQELLEENLPDWLLAETHFDLLTSDDDNIRTRALQEGYKVKGKYTPEKHEHTIREYQDLSDEELAKLYEAKKERKYKLIEEEK